MTGYRHSATARAVLRSLVPVICPPEAHALADAIVDHMALTIGASPRLLRVAIDAGLRAYDASAVITRGRRAHKLTGDAAERYFASWERGPTPLHRQFAHGINQLMSLSCYEQPEILDAIGYRPAPWIEQVRAKRLAVYADDVRAQDAAILAPDPLRPGRQKRRA